MRGSSYLPLCLAIVSVGTNASGQQAPDGVGNDKATRKVASASQPAKDAAVGHQPLSILETTKVPSEGAGIFYGPLKCDSKGNLYLRTNPDGVSGIRKMSSKGEKIGLIQAGAGGSEIKGGVAFASYFALSPEDDVYQLVAAGGEISRFVFLYKPDGTYKSKIRLQPGFPWSTAQLAPFPSGELLVTGQERDAEGGAMRPFTGIFSSDGTLLKEIKLKDDDEIRGMAEAGDARVTSPQNPSSNRAVSWGQAEAASDGNVYVMRRLSPAIVYAISAGGEVVRRFKVDIGRKDHMPFSMHIAGNRIAILFYHPQTMVGVLRITDLEGHTIATYDEPLNQGKPALGLAFTCYTENPQRFTFLGVTDDQKLEIQVAGP